MGRKENQLALRSCIIYSILYSIIYSIKYDIQRPSGEGVAREENQLALNVSQVLFISLSDESYKTQDHFVQMQGGGDYCILGPRE